MYLLNNAEAVKGLASRSKLCSKALTAARKSSADNAESAAMPARQATSVWVWVHYHEVVCVTASLEDDWLCGGGH